MIKKFLHFVFVILVLGIVIGVPLGWMYHRSYSDPEVHYFYATKGEGDQSLRFVVISDLYSYVFEGGNGVIADLAGNTSPDAILIGGNMITADTQQITPLTDLIKRLIQVAPVYYSYGEQELEYVKAHSAQSDAEDPLRAEIEKAGAVVLDEEFADVSLYGVGVRIGGMFNNAYEMTNLRNEVKKKYESTWTFLTEYQNTDALKILLSSKPESFAFGDACDTWKVDLVVSGNDLGGLVVLPYYGGVFSSAQGYFPEYVHGMYKKGDVNLFITSGLSAPAGILPPRLNNPPEIAVIDIDGLTMNMTAEAPPAGEEAAVETPAPQEQEETAEETQAEESSEQEEDTNQEEDSAEEEE